MVKKTIGDAGIDTANATDELLVQMIRKDVEYLRERMERETPDNLIGRLSLLEKGLSVLETYVEKDLPRINELINEIEVIKTKQNNLEKNMKYYLILVGIIASLLTIIAMMFGNVLTGGK